MASPSIRRATYRLVMDFTHLCSQSSMYLQQLGTRAKNGYRPATSAQSFFCRIINKCKISFDWSKEEETTNQNV